MIISRVALFIPILYSALSIAGPIDDKYQNCISAANIFNNSTITECAEESISLASKLISNSTQIIVKKGQVNGAEEAENRNNSLLSLRSQWYGLIQAQCDAEGMLIGMPAANVCTVELFDLLVQRMRNLAIESQ